MVRNTLEVKQLNKERIRQEIQKSEKCTKASISKETELSVATCGSILNEMLEEGEIIQISQEENIIGRPANQFVYNPDYQHVLVMWINNEQGINTIEYAVADALGHKIKHDQLHPEVITYDLIESLVADTLQSDGLIQRMAFGIPGVSHRGVIEYCDVESVVGVDVEGQLQAKFGIEVEVRNDMDFISNGVYHTVPHDGGNLVTMYFPPKGKGCVGCGLVINGKVLRGHSKFAGELSYILEGFGIPGQQQIEMLSDRTAFCEMVGKMVLIIIGTIDPETIMVMGNDINQEDLAVIQENCKKVVSESHIPKLLADNKITEYYINGLIREALEQLQFKVLK